MSDVAIAEQRPSIEKRSEIRGKLRQALDAMIWEGMTYDVAARTFNYHVRSMRRALARPDVLAYLNRERQVLRASVSPRNIHRLVAIRDAADNMPAVNAIKLLEELGDDHSQRQSGISASPGVTIRVVTVVQQQPASIPMGFPDQQSSAANAVVIDETAQDHQSSKQLVGSARPSDASRPSIETAPRRPGRENS
jgi:hypothetical protein